MSRIRFRPSVQVSNRLDNQALRAKARASGKSKIVNLLHTALEDLHLSPQAQEASELPLTETGLPAVPKTNRIFVVHGHDDEMRETIARTLEWLDLIPVILREQPNQGRTVIEKFFDYSDVGYAVVALSPDDMGYARHADPSNARPRARQNVIFELGFFVGKLGRDRVFVLYRETDEFEMPSDYAGVLYVPYNQSANWRLDLTRELQAASYNVDANNLV